MGGGSTHLGWGRSPEELERQIQQLQGQSIQQGNTINNLLEALGIQIENLSVNEGNAQNLTVTGGDFIDARIYNPMSIVESIGENEVVLERLREYLGLIFDPSQFEQRPNVWEEYTGS